MRDYLGCYDRGDATAPRAHFHGTRWETRKCPRALLIMNPDVQHLMRVYAQLPDGKPSGAYGPAELSAVAVEAFGIIDQARGYRTERMYEDAKAEARRERRDGAEPVSRRR